MQNEWNSHILLVKIQIGTATLEHSLTISNKVQCTITVRSSNPTDVLSEITYGYTKICIQVFIAPLLIIIKNWKNPSFL